MQQQRDRSPFMRGPVQLTNQAAGVNMHQEQISSLVDDNEQQMQQHMRNVERQLAQINEQQQEEGQSDMTVINQQEGAIPYMPENQAIGNQLEMQSMMSDHASVMGQSPVKPNRIASRRGTKKKADN